MLGQLVTHMEQKLNLDSRHLKHQLEKDHGAKWKTDKASGRKTQECLRNFRLWKVFHTKHDPPKKTINKLNFINIINFCS